MNTRDEADGSLRVVYGASIRSCRPCPLREQCQWQGSATAKPRQVSVLLHPLVVGSAPLRLSGLESQRAPACLSATRAEPTGRGEPAAHVTVCRCRVHQRGRDPFPCAACPHESLVGDAPGLQCTERHCWPGHDHALRSSQRLRCLAGSNERRASTRSHQRSEAREKTSVHSSDQSVSCGPTAGGSR